MSLDALNRLDGQTLLRPITWFIRAGAILLIGVIAFAAPTARGAELALELVALAVAVAVLGYWWFSEYRRAPVESPGPGLALALGAMAVASGFVCSAPDGGVLFGLTLMAVIAAGSNVEPRFGAVILAISVASVAGGTLVFGHDTASLLEWGLALLIAFIGGRNRAGYRHQAEQAALLLAQMEQLRAEQHRVAVLDERNRIAREIHDVLAHSVGALGINIQAARAVLSEHRDVDRALGLLEQAQRLATDGLLETRRAVHALRADSTTSLDEQIAVLAETHRTRHHTVVDFEIDGEPRALTPEAGVALIRVAQEALVNAAKHGPRQPVRARLSYTGDAVRLSVSNELPTDPVPDGESAFGSVNGGYGLKGMRERLLLIGGTLTAGADGYRWTVTARVPQ